MLAILIASAFPALGLTEEPNCEAVFPRVKTNLNETALTKLKMRFPMDEARGELPSDSPWGGLTRWMIGQTDSAVIVRKLLASLLPSVSRDIRRDAKNAAYKKLWGQAINYDELVHAAIVEPLLVRALAEDFKVPLTNNTIVHAGVQHTYGYLFSVLQTSFGYKRSRWVKGEIETGFDFSAGTLGPFPEGGTLFSNVTYFLGKIAFKDEPKKLRELEIHAKYVSKNLKAFDFSKVKPLRLKETVTVSDLRGQVRTVVIRTDIVPYFTPNGSSRSLLIYSVDDPLHGGSRLITGFPVAKDPRAFLNLDAPETATSLGENRPIATHYNAFVEGVTNQIVSGRREISP